MAVARCWIPRFLLSLGRRTLRVDTAQGLPVTNVFAYNHRSEVTNAVMGDADYSYEFDDIGNRERAAADAELTVYSANALNQYASVTVAGQGVPVAYDLDGNMLTNGVWAYTWDAENRMVSAVSEGAVVVSNAYDYLSRRVRKEVYAWDTQLTAYRLQFTAHYVWDSWNIAAEIVVDSVAACTNVHFYTWGLDLSGTVQGAGGVGGLLEDTVLPAADSLLPTAFFSCYDANGNVTDYVDASGNLRARYAYSAFGETTLQSGDMAGTFTHRFSTKPFDTETGVSKYQLRDYLPSLGRWASRDNMGEIGGDNLYGFCSNSSVKEVDVLGYFATAWEVYITNYRFDSYPQNKMRLSKLYADLIAPHFDKLRDQLEKDLIRLCPVAGTTVPWIRPGENKTTCCSAKKCIDRAKLFAASYTEEVRDTYWAERRKYGFVVGGVLGNIRASELGTVKGETYMDRFEEDGLKCSGWVEVGQTIFNRIMGQNGDECWSSSQPMTKPSIWRLKLIPHTWFRLFAPYGSLDVDPWASGGSSF